MIRVRKLVLAIAAATSLTSGMAHALGLGEISLQSSLNQPLNADIALLEVRDLDNTEIIPRLASAEDFSKAGVERDFFLTNLKFTPVILPNGKSMIRVTSAKPVREPYLNFLVEVIWPSGRVLREYTLLLDPPMYSPETAAMAPRLPVAAAAPTYRAQTKPTDGPFKVGSLPGSNYSSTAVTPQPKPAAAKPAALDGQYKTGSNDTLWAIAQRVKGGGSLNQTMLAIQDLNPDAFVAGNINRLKSGQVLRLPDSNQINARSRSQASAAVTEQNAAWREGRSLPPVTARQLDATKRDEAGAAPAEVETTDSLRLVAADAGKAASTSEKGEPGDSKALSDKLAVTQESLDTSRRQGDELSGRVTDLQGQLDKLQKLIELKDSQLAQLQADLAAQEKLATTTAPVEQPTAESTVTPEVVVVEPPVATATPEVAPAEPQPTEVLAEGVSDTQQAAVEQPPVDVPAPVNTPEVEAPVEVVKPAEAIVPVQIASETAVVVEETPEPVSMVDEVLGNPLLLGAGGAGLLIILLGLMAMSRRNAQKEEDDASDEQFVDRADDNNFADDLDLPEESFAGLDDNGKEPVEEAAKTPAADALAEADIYIAYGKFNQAADLLKSAVYDEPQRTDLQLKLLEVTAELGDREDFLRQAADLDELGSVNAELDRIKAKYPAMVAAGFAAGVGSVAASAAPDELDIDDLISDAPLDLQPQDADDAFDLSLDELDGDLEDELLAPSPLAEQELDEFSLDIDFDKPEVKSTDDLEFDLSLEDLAAEIAGSETKPVAMAGDDFTDFDLDLGADNALSSEGATEFSLATDSDFEFEPIQEEASPVVAEEFLETLADQAAPSDFDLPSTAELQPLEPIAAELDAEDDVAFDEFTAEGLMDSSDADELPAGDDEDFDFLSGTDETATKLDLARAYIDMGDAEGARDILDEVIAEGSDTQQQEARELIGKLV